MATVRVLSAGESLRSLRARGLGGVQFDVADQHDLKNASTRGALAGGTDAPACAWWHWSIFGEVLPR